MSYRVFAWPLILFACFYGIGSYPLLDDNEGLYAAIARDMLLSQQWIVPHLNGLPYIEKPPMLYWFLAGSMGAFGINEWAVRLVPALALFATACMLRGFLSRTARSENAGYTAALIMVTSLPLLVMGRMVLCDMLMTCFLTAALLCFFLWHTGKGGKYIYGFYAFLAFAALTKGFVTIILAGGSVALFLIWQRSGWHELRRALSPGGILLFLLIAAPWHTAASLQEPGFAWFYFINEHLLRFLNLRQPHDYYTGHAWYYLPRVLGYLLPWTFFLALLWRKKGALTLVPAGEKMLRRFLWSWFLFCLLFFSLSGAKANYYMIAGMPPLVMLLALAMRPIPMPRIIGFATPILLSLPLLLVGVELADGRLSQKEAADFLLKSGRAEVALYQDFEDVSSLAFYLGKPLTVVDSHSSDLLYGQKEFPGDPHFITLAQWSAKLPAMPLLVMNKRLDGLMAAQKLCVWHRFQRVSLVLPCE